MSMVYCRGCAKEIHETAPTCPVCGARQFAQSNAHSSGINQIHDYDTNLIRQIADYERISGYIWIVLGIIQIVTIVGIIAGIWNIVAGRSRLKIVDHILARNAAILEGFEGISGLIVIGVLNAILGGVIGLIFVGFDFYIRDKILTNRHLFSHDISSDAHAVLSA